MSDSVRPHRRQPTRFPRPWDSPGKNTRVGCHFLLQCMKVKSESEVTKLCSTLSDPMDHSLPGSCVHGIFQARVLEWGASAFSLLSYERHVSLQSDSVVCACSVVSNSLDPRDYSLPGFSVHGIFQARIVEWVAISSSREEVLPDPGIKPMSPMFLADRFFNLELCGKPTQTAWVQIMALLLSKYAVSQAAYLFKIMLLHPWNGNSDGTYPAGLL